MSRQTDRQTDGLSLFTTFFFPNPQLPWEKETTDQMLKEQTIANSQDPLNPKEPKHFIFASDALTLCSGAPRP